MASRVCETLIDDTEWQSYAHDLGDAPSAEGIYTIGVERAGHVRYLYVGHTKDIRRRLKEHENQTLEIDKFVQQKFSQRNVRETLRIKCIASIIAELLSDSFFLQVFITRLILMILINL